MQIDVISAFQFKHLDILGDTCAWTYKMNPEMEGTMLFFPSKLSHGDEDRISISGNITLNTTKIS